MYEEDMKILNNQIERTKRQMKQVRSETYKYELEKKLMILYDMRADLLIQIEHAPDNQNG